MTVRPDVAELLRAGYGDRTIARQLSVTESSVKQARAVLGLPAARGGNKPAGSVEDLFWRRTQPVEGDHLEWTGHRTNKGVAAFKWGGTMYTAGRIAYRIRYGTDPVGRAHATCGHDGCVAPAHIADSATTPRRGHHSAGGRRSKVSRAQITELLHAGQSNQAIAKRLRTDPKRVARIRAELNMAPAPVKVQTFAEKWAASTDPTDDGHLRWTGRLRDGVTPSLVHHGRDYSARKAAFEELHGRPAVGNVFPGCGEDWCVRPDHLEDRPMRERLANQYEAIFGEAAA